MTDLPLTSVLNDTTCGFRLNYPQGWGQADPNPQSYVALVGTTRPILTYLQVIYVYHYRTSISAEALGTLARSVAADNCLRCLRPSLRWTDRYTDGSKSVSYNIFRPVEPSTIAGQQVFYYGLDFFIYDDARARQPAAEGWSRARLLFFIPVQLYQSVRTEEWTKSIVATLQFTPVPGPCLR
jgi:hypothetical protein